MEIGGLGFRRIRLSEKATNRLRTFKSRTGLTPNIACRLALSFSMAQQNIPKPELYEDRSGQIIDRYTFLGEHEEILLSLFILWCEEHNVDSENYYDFLMAHINRGAEQITNRVKSISDIPILLGERSE
ncbi:MAG: DNA sulfur modification protein DndE [Candidatus Delongbacteria bacterium]|nr:DNA sulfur modification protein DndE [Candidatus Delongbacteria bacterium]